MERNYIIKPVVTEKSVSNSQINKVTFIVTEDANKVAISRQLEALYGVKPEKVNILKVQSKERAIGRRTLTKRKAHKRALVTFPAGKDVDIFKIKPKAQK